MVHQLRHDQDEQQLEELKLTFHSFELKLDFNKNSHIHFVNIPSTASTFQKLCYHNEIVIMQCKMQHLKL